MLVRLATTLLAGATLVAAQLSGSVGPTTPLANKKTVCNVKDYGLNTSDIGPALLSAFNNCVKKTAGSVLYVPPGNYNMATWVTLSSGVNWAFQMDGIITRTGTAGGHMIIINGGSDVEVFSSTRKGAFQGAGVDFHKQGLHIYGPRIMRLVKVKDFSVHDLQFIDSPAFHLILDNTINGDIYNILIQGHDEGGLDGMDVTCTNCHVQNVEVTNRDECVCVKSPSKNLLIEDIFCNQSGGMSMGSFNQSTAVENVYMRNIKSYYSTQMLMIKTYPGGNGYIRNSKFENFQGYTSAYALEINQYWQNTAGTGGVQISNLAFSNWLVQSDDSTSRAPYYIVCSNEAPCTGITIDNVSQWDPTHGSTAWRCQSAYGTSNMGGCLKSGSGGGYSAVTSTSKTKPNGWSAPNVKGRSGGFPLSQAIPISTLPWPARGGSTTAAPPKTTTTTAAVKTTAAPTTAKASPAPTSNGSCSAKWGQCGGQGYSGPTCCQSGSTCTFSNQWYSQCL